MVRVVEWAESTRGCSNFLGTPLALHALQRRSPQVGRVAFSANRNLATYEAMRAPVWADASKDTLIDATGNDPGPLAGTLVGLGRCETPYLAMVPCDAPRFPFNLIERLGQGLLRDEADIAMAATRSGDGSIQAQPVFCLLRANLFERLARDLQAGARQVERWIKQQAHAIVVFKDASPFSAPGSSWFRREAPGPSRRPQRSTRRGLRVPCDERLACHRPAQAW